MRVEVDDGDGTVLGIQRLQDRIGDGVIATEREHLGARGNQLGHSRFDLVDGEFNVERVDGNVTRIDNLSERKRFRVLGRVVRAQQSRRFANVAWSEPSTRAIAGARIKRDTNDHDVGVVYFIASGQASKGWCPGEPGHHRCVYLAELAPCSGAGS